MGWSGVIRRHRAAGQINCWTVAPAALRRQEVAAHHALYADGRICAVHRILRLHRYLSVPAGAVLLVPL